ncbi:MAG: wax ester/triacylglycerol synthase family O-acyltransferase [Actinobacteria bacterium]|nr:MAG: wax ester/triacylglycerol synthase family O-acyltransferase [Actinomycetota bacterium]
MTEGDAVATEALEHALVFPREMEPIDYLLFRGEQDARSRAALLSINLLDIVPEFERVLAAYERASRVLLRFRQHVVVPPLPVAPPQWIIDPDFDISFHVRRSRLPEPGTIRQLLDFAQPIYAAPFDTARPLWEAHLVEGLTEGGARAALVLKTNHALSDGVGGMELARQLYDFERDADRGPLPPLPVPEDVSPADLMRRAVRRAPVTLVGGAVRRVRGAAGAGARTVRHPGRAVGDARRMLASARRMFGPPPTAPSPLLRRRSLGRRFEWLEFPLDRFRRAAKGAGGSVNDAYLAALCGALRRYHDALGVPIDALPLAMPVNLRTDDDPAGGNRFAGARIAAPIGEPDPARRILLIREQVLTAVAEPAMTALSAVAPVMARLPMPLLNAIASSALTTDVQASNVPGFPEPPYIAGARVVKTLPFGPVPGVAMMVVMLSEGGICYLGVNYDTASVTDRDLFARCLRDGVDEVLALEHEPARPPTPVGLGSVVTD